MNDMINTINEPTRVTTHSSTLLDPVAVSNVVTVHNSGIFETDNDISDHYGTYAHIKVDFQSNFPFKRKVWNYRRANCLHLNELIRNTIIADWNILKDQSVNEACETFTSIFFRNV